MYPGLRVSVLQNSYYGGKKKEIFIRTKIERKYIYMHNTVTVTIRMMTFIIINDFYTFLWILQGFQKVLLVDKLPRRQNIYTGAHTRVSFSGSILFKFCTVVICMLNECLSLLVLASGDRLTIPSWTSQVWAFANKNRVKLEYFLPLKFDSTPAQVFHNQKLSFK